MLRELLANAVRHPQYKLLALALAIIAWTYVQGDEVHTTRIKAPIVWMLPEDLTTPEQLPSSVTLTIRGTRADTRRAKEADVDLPVDIRDIGVGEHTLAFGDFRPRNLPTGVEVLSTSPSSVRFMLDEVSGRKVSVQPVLVGQPAGDHLIESVTIEPQVVEVVGPRVVVEQIREVDTAPIDVSQVTADARIEVDLDLPRSVRLADPTQRPVAVVDVVPRNALREFQVPVVVWGTYDWVARPASVSVTLQGPTSTLQGIASGDVIAVVHLPDTPDRARYEAPFGPGEGPRMRIVHPGGPRVQVVRVNPPRIEVVRR